jgi:hypothetical protein
LVNTLHVAERRGQVARDTTGSAAADTRQHVEVELSDRDEVTFDGLCPSTATLLPVPDVPSQ